VRTTLMQPVRTLGRIVVGPRQVRNGYARIVAAANGAGRIELYDVGSGAWTDAHDSCTFDEVWSGPAVFDARYLTDVA
jgi:hypothetical protein